jgi:alkylated DNA repair dioxygenase AlkB
MDLFSEHVDPNEDLLPYDGTVNYLGKILDKKTADHYFEVLMNTIEWKNDEAVIYGKKLVTKRKVAWYGEKEFEYTYSNTTKKALPFTEQLLELKTLVEKSCGHTFNSCLLNLYNNGDETMAWHSDAEKDLEKNGAIGSVSLGAERKFAFKHKRTAEKVSVLLEHGSLLIMKGETQTFWLHRLPPTTKIRSERINLTFRTIVEKI